MKMVMALIRNERLRQVREALLKAGITGFTVSATLGMGERVPTRLILLANSNPSLQD